MLDCRFWAGKSGQWLVVDGCAEHSRCERNLTTETAKIGRRSVKRSAESQHLSITFTSFGRDLTIDEKRVIERRLIDWDNQTLMHTVQTTLRKNEKGSAEIHAILNSP